MKQLFFKRKWIILFLSVIFISSLFGIIATSSRSPNKVVKADSPDYRLLFDYKDYHYDKVLVISEQTPYSLVDSGTTNSRKYGYYNSDFYISVYNKKLTPGEIPLSDIASFNFTDINYSMLVCTKDDGQIISFSLSNTLGETFNNFTHKDYYIIGNAENLKDAKYTINLTFRYYISDTGGTMINFHKYGRLEICSSFYIDTTAPSITFNSEDTENYFNNNQVTINFSDTLSGISSAYFSVSQGKDFPYSAEKPLKSGQTFTDEGNYTVVVTDKAGNVTTKHFTIDKTAPVLDAHEFTYDYGTYNSNNLYFTNKAFYVNWSTSTSTSKGVFGQCSNKNDVLSVKYGFNGSTAYFPLPDTEYTAGTTLTQEGVYEFCITDKAGNEGYLDFVLDKTAPELKVYTDNNGYDNNSVGIYPLNRSNTYGAGKFYSISADKEILYYSFTTNGNYPTSATILKQDYNNFTLEGNYLLKYSDIAGNTSTYNFTIDKTAPVLDLPVSVNIFQDVYYYNKDFSITWSTSTIKGVFGQCSNKNDVLSVKYGISNNNSFPTVADTEYTAGTTLTQEGNYYFIITDSAGNFTEYKLVLDKTNPTATLEGVVNNGFTNKDVTITSKDFIMYIYSTGTTFISNEDAIADGDYYDGSLSAEGHYTVAVRDLAFNYTYYNFTIDKTAPTLQVYQRTGIAIENRTKENIYATWNSKITGIDDTSGQRTRNGDELTVFYTYNSANFIPYTKGIDLTSAGFYQFKIVDSAGNEFYSNLWEINRTPPTFQLYSESGAEINSQHFACNQIFDIKWDNSLCTATLNGEQYLQNTNNYITVDGAYNFVLTDELGNKNEQTLHLITTLPTKNFDNLKSPNNRWFETTNTEGKLFAFNSYDNALEIAVAREESLIKQVIWDGTIQCAPEDIDIAQIESICYIYKSIALASQNNAYFNIATLNNAINHYAKSSINTKYIPSVPSTIYDKEEVYREVYFTKNSITFNTIQNCFIYVDGIEQQYPYTLTTAGEHSIKEVDIAGNSISYSVYIDIELPIIKVTNLKGNMPTELKYGSSSYFTYGIIITLDDADKQALLKVNDTYYVGTQAELKATGTYNLTIRDVAGNVGSCTVYISLTTPTIDFQIQEVGELMNSFTVEIKPNHNINKLNYINIFKFNTETEAWDTLTTDNNNQPINKSNYIYNFSVSGEYRFIISDIFGRFIEERYSFTKSAPVGCFYNSLNIIIPNYAHSNHNVYFSWNKYLNCSAEITILGGQTIAYNMNSFISNEGVYRITLKSNVDNVFSIYEVTIDKTAPTGTLLISPKDKPSETFANGNTTRHPVSLNWTEDFCTATLNGEQYFSGAPIKDEGKHVVILTDKAGNETYYTFTIDLTAPTISANSGGKQLKSGEFTNRDVILSWKESGCTCILNNNPISNNKKVVIEGYYTTTLTDAYGNVASFSFTIDKTAPTGQVFVNDKLYSGDTLNVIKINGSAYLSWLESGCTATLNKSFIYEENSILSNNGFYTIVLYDVAGNSTQYDIEIKNTPPKATLNGGTKELYNYETSKTQYQGAITNQNARFTWTERNCICTCNENTYSNGATIKDEGFYRFTLTDAYGNTVIYEVTIDKTAPVLTVRKGLDSFVENNEIVKNNVTISWEEQSASATLNGEQIKTGKILKEEGEYTVVLTDKAGNQSYLTFILDFSASEGTLISNGKVIQSGSITRYKTYFTWSESGCTATLNGEPYSKGKTVSEEGNYVVVLTDEAGNTSTYTFTIDLTAPTGELLFTQTAKDNITAGDVSFMWAEKNCTATLNGEPYVMGTAISLDGEYTIILFDEAGNSMNYYVIIDKTAPVLFAKTVQNVILNNNSTTLSDIYFTWNEKNCTATLNGEPYEKETKISATGTYTLSLADKIGNTTTLTIIVDKTVPFVDIMFQNGDKFPYLNNGWYATWGSDKNYTATLNGSDYVENTEIINEGKYVLIVSNSLGATSSYEIIIDRTAPTGEFYHLNNELFNSEFTIKNFYFTWEEQSASATLNGSDYLKNSTVSKEGNYRILLTDEAGNTQVYEMFLTKSKPTLAFFSQNTNTEITSNRVYVTDNVIVVKSDENDIVTLEGEIFDITQPLAVGEYSFVVTNEYGISDTFNIIIRKEPTQLERGSNNGLSKLFAGSTTGTIIFVATLGVLLSLAVCIPLFKGIFKRNPLKKRLK